MISTATDETNTMEFKSISRVTKKEELIKLLELINTTNDMNLLEKLFSALSGYLMFGNADYDMVIKCNSVYEKICSMLLKGTPKKITVALHFLSALLVVDAADDVTSHRRMLGHYARGRCRTSGCLALLNDMFTNCMMYHDTWKALCQCISIACCECEMNQTYCAHLIPVCIEKCCQTNTEVFLVLHSLLLNHKRNIQLFFECNGASVFTREVLVNDKCLQLLAAVSADATARPQLHRTAVVDHLRNFIHLYGPHTQIGQKATIILYHIDPSKRDLNASISEENKKTTLDNSHESKMNIQIAENELDDTQTLLKNIMKEIFAYKKSESEHSTRTNFRNTDPNVLRMRMRLNNCAPDVSVHSPFVHVAPTATNLVHQNSHMRPTLPLNKSKQFLNRTHRSVAHKRHDADLSFSFLENDNIDSHNSIGKYANRDANMTKASHVSNFRTRAEKYRKQHIDKSKIKSKNFIDTRSLYNGSCRNLTVDDKSFKPIFSSTPNKILFKTTHQKMNESKIAPFNSNKSQSRINQHGNGTVQKRRQQNTDKNIRNRSLSSKFFSAINNSCTTFVKTVANIFKRKEDCENYSEHFTQTSIQENDNAHSLSFTKYMQKRDAVLRHTRRNVSASLTELSARSSLSCVTCDTATLKRKLKHNEQLKKTIRKLKLGVNLFGCDFKKISRMWPPDSYMTPEYLCKLYRKLLSK